MYSTFYLYSFLIFMFFIYLYFWTILVHENFWELFVGK